MEIIDVDGIVYVFQVPYAGLVYRQIHRPVVFNMSGECRSFRESVFLACGHELGG